MEKFGKELEFISFIKRDGTGVIMIGGEWNVELEEPKTDNMSYVDEEVFRVEVLSLSNKTFIASGFNSFVVRLKINPPLKYIRE